MAAALISLLMLTYASVLSSVMQVEMAHPGGMMGPICLASPTQAHTSPKTSQGHQAACPYCAAAAHPPIVGSATPLRIAVAYVFSAYHLVSRHGPRGPPALQPRARGPPSDLTLI